MDTDRKTETETHREIERDYISNLKYSTHYDFNQIGLVYGNFISIDFFFFFYNSSEKRKNVKVCVCVMNIVHSAGSVHPWHKTLFPFFGHNIRQ